MSGIAFDLDGQAVNFPDTFTYKGMMYSGLPNMAHTFGYINASWTLRADLTAEYVCRLLNHMTGQQQAVVTPTLRAEDAGMPTGDWIQDFSAGYMRRMMHLFPKQGRGPWRNTQDYKLDKKMIRQAPIEDGVLVFAEAGAANTAAVDDSPCTDPRWLNAGFGHIAAASRGQCRPTTFTAKASPTKEILRRWPARAHNWPFLIRAPPNPD